MAILKRPGLSGCLTHAMFASLVLLTLMLPRSGQQQVPASELAEGSARALRLAVERARIEATAERQVESPAAEAGTPAPDSEKLARGSEPQAHPEPTPDAADATAFSLPPDDAPLPERQPRILPR